jgi:MFS family permease
VTTEDDDHLLSLYLRSLGVPAARIGVEVGASSVLATVCTLGVGPVINRWGAKPLLQIGMGAYLLAALGLVAFPHEAAVTGFRALQGVGAALVLPSALTLVPQIVSLRAGTAIGAASAITTVAPAAGRYQADTKQIPARGQSETKEPEVTTEAADDVRPLGARPPRPNRA